LDLIDVAQDTDQRRALVNTVRKLQVLEQFSDRRLLEKDLLP
jgi:hypothetical protein